MTLGTPQGSALSPILWNILINTVFEIDLQENSTLLAYADDLLLLIKRRDFDELQTIANITLSRLRRWTRRNKLKFNLDKTKYIIFTKKRIVPELDIRLNTVRIAQCDTLSYLGLLFDRKLNWNRHIDNLYDNTLRIINGLSVAARATWGLRSEVLKEIYEAAVLPKMLYAVHVWHPAVERKKNLVKLERLQRLIAIKICKGYRTLSFEATILLAGLLPIQMKIEERTTLYNIRKGKRGYKDLTLDKIERITDCKSWLHPATSLWTGPGITSENTDVFTDGSKDGENVGCAWLFRAQDGRNIEHQYKLESYCSNNQAEKFAVLKVTEYIYEYPLQTNTHVTINTDNKVLLDSVNNWDIHDYLTDQIRNKLLMMRTVGEVVNLKWVKAHCGIEGSGRADCLAKEAAKSDLPPSYHQAPLSYIKMNLKLDFIKRWDHIWVTSAESPSLHRFIPHISIHNYRHIHSNDYKLTQVLTEHGNTKQYLKRFNIIQTDLCDEDGQVQNFKHIIYECKRFDRQRFELIKSIIIKRGN